MTIEETKDFVFKIVLCGDAAVGKTSLINQYVDETFHNDYRPTLGANIIRKDVLIEEINVNARLIIWDIAGQEKYNTIRSMYFQGCAGALLVYDVTRPITYETITSKWLKDFKKFVQKEAAHVLIGNKIDLQNNRIITYEQGMKLAEKIQASDFIETSAKFGNNVNEAFFNLVKKILLINGEILEA